MVETKSKQREERNIFESCLSDLVTMIPAEKAKVLEQKILSSLREMDTQRQSSSQEEEVKFLRSLYFQACDENFQELQGQPEQ